jgi:very-short-patch-repair endonuclease
MTGEPTARGQLVRIADLQGAGDSYSQARAQVADMQRLARGAYAQTIGLTPEAAHLLTARAVLTQVSQAVASHTTAATAWGLPVRTMDLQRVHVSPLLGRAGKPKRGPSYDFHNTPVPPEDAEIACTSAMRTVLDCARLIRSDWAVVIADAALNRGLINAAEFAERARRVHHLTGAARARALPSLCSARSESPGETLLRMRLRRLGILPTEQAILSDVDGLPRVDFLVDGSLVIEFDGRAKYSMHGDPEQAHWEEKQRQDRISEAGYEVLRVTWGELWDEGALHTRVNRAQARAYGRRTRNPLR